MDPCDNYISDHDVWSGKTKSWVSKIFQNIECRSAYETILLGPPELLRVLHAEALIALTLNPVYKDALV